MAIDCLGAKRIWNLERIENKQWKMTEVSSPVTTRVEVPIAMTGQYGERRLRWKVRGRIKCDPLW